MDFLKGEGIKGGLRKKLKIYKIKLEQDLIVNADDGWASFDEMFKKYGKIIPLDIKI